MLTFRDGGYTKEQVRKLYDIVSIGFSCEVKCDKQCCTCEYNRLCKDVISFLQYMSKKL